MMKNFLVNLLASFNNPHSYKKWLVLPQKNIIKFFSVNILLIGLINGAIFSFKNLPNIVNSYKNFQQTLVEQYPNDLNISWQNQQLTLSPDNFKNLDLNLKNINNFKDLDDSLIYYRENEVSETETSDLVKQEQTLFLVTKQKIYFRTENNEVVSKELKDLIKTEDFTLTKTDLPYLVEAINQKLDQWLPKIQLIFPVFIAGVNLTSTFMVSFIFATFLWFVLKISPLTIKRWNFAWRLTLAVLITVSYLELIIRIIYPNNFSNIRELAFWLITGYILLSWKFPRFKIQTN